MPVAKVATCRFPVSVYGIVVGRSRRNTLGATVSTVDTEQELYDSTAPWRDRAVDGTLHSGEVVEHPRSRDRTSL